MFLITKKIDKKLFIAVIKNITDFSYRTSIFKDFCVEALNKINLDTTVDILEDIAKEIVEKMLAAVKEKGMEYGCMIIETNNYISIYNHQKVHGKDLSGLSSGALITVTEEEIGAKDFLNAAASLFPVRPMKSEVKEHDLKIQTRCLNIDDFFPRSPTEEIEEKDKAIWKESLESIDRFIPKFILILKQWKA